ncbi:hypothetical protein E2320_002859 [Naja naja]|nr:hypothetical protein E2320_002859 [Naja naja]
MAAESQAVAMSSQEMVNTLLLHQQEVEAEMRKLQATILQLVQPLVVPIALVEQPVSSHSCLPEKFGGEADKMKNFIGQCELFMGIRAAEFPTDHAKVSFILSLLKESAAKWAQPIIEDNDAIMNNYQNFMERFRAYFGNLIETVTASQKIQLLKQGNRRVQMYIADFKLLAAEANWNESALIDQFKHGLHSDIQSELEKQGVPRNLDELFHSCLLIDVHLEELKWKQETSCRPKIKSNFMRPPLFPLASTSGQVGEPMQLGAARRMAIAKERQRRRDAAACFYCGKSGHIVRACPTKEPWRESWTADQDAEEPHSSHQSPI